MEQRFNWADLLGMDYEDDRDEVKYDNANENTYEFYTYLTSHLKFITEELKRLGFEDVPEIDSYLWLNSPSQSKDKVIEASCHLMANIIRMIKAEAGDLDMHLKKSEVEREMLMESEGQDKTRRIAELGNLMARKLLLTERKRQVDALLRKAEDLLESARMFHRINVFRKDDSEKDVETGDDRSFALAMDIVKRLIRNGRYKRYDDLWSHVVLGMLYYPSKVYFEPEFCLECGEKLVSSWFRSSQFSWRQRAGREGKVTFCPRCLELIRTEWNIIS